ncbi:MAG TPA: OmpA family protein, partial [Bacteroidales bacterium]|nr:OmpA family protein [Bacteroidales bacterium]
TSENDVTRNVKPEKQQTVTESQSREKDSKEQASDYTDFAKGDIREFDNLLFTYQKARLTKTSRETLNQLADYMQTHTGLKLKIKGYTDCIGDEDENLALSRKRAENTANYLKAKGIAANRLGIKAYGEQQLIRPCQDSPLYYMTGNLKNRRVELELLPNN